ncbi:MAG: VOC family protein [Xanthobacteraceae bacterium]|nr:VOC family protein [Xanthobacteraceae bacterium]QYK45535.1 MAG: VOC family protein [Xanthobacteraceae bacterium]
MTVSFERTAPILRMFSVEKTKEFYFEFLGFKLDWEHRFEKDAPLYMQISRAGATLHLSEHFGDGVPGSAVYFSMKGIEEFHRELTAKNYRHARPGILDQEWGMREIMISDPSGNKLRFGEPKS